MRTFIQGDRIRVQRSNASRPFLLEDRDPVYGIGPDSPEIRIAIIGEAPGENEERAQTPFVGRAGKFLTWGLSQAALDIRGIYMDNVIDRRPPKNNIKSVEAIDAIEAQKESFQELLGWLAEKGVRVILALGNTAKDAFGINGSITRVRGSVYEYNLDWPGVVVDPTAEPCHFLVIPTYHPSYLMRSRWTGTGSDRADNSLTWIADLKKCKDLSTHGYTRPVEDFLINPSRDQVVEFIDDIIQNDRLAAIDIETAGFNPRKDSIVCVGIATSSQRGICIPRYRTGPDVTPRTPFYGPSDRPIVEEKIRELLTSARQMYQNALFDVNYLQESGYDVDLTKIEHDTMLLHHAVNPELSHKLGFIVSVYGATPYWKEDFSKRDFTIWEMDPADLQRYNIRDCVVLHQVLRPLLYDLEETGTELAYQESLSIIPPVLEMMQTGLKLSVSRLRSFKESILSDIQRLEEEMRTLGKLPPSFNLNSKDDVRLFLFGVKARKYEVAADYDKHKHGTKIREKRKQIYEVGEKTKCLVQHNYRGRHGKSGAISVDKEGLSGLRVFAQNRLRVLKQLTRRTPAHDEEEAGLKSLVAWLNLYSEWTQLKKLESTYTSFPVREDGRVHTRYMIHGTVTGRLSSREPNLQNLPKSENRVRRCFVAPANWSIVSADYNSLEFGTIAYETGDPTMIEAFESGTSQHDINTQALFGITKSDPNWSIGRNAAKIFQFATQYGGSLRRVYENICQEVPELDLSWAKFNEAVDNLYNKLDKYGEWRERIVSTAQTDRTVWNAFGRCRILYGPEKDIGREALNFPCQSAAAHIINGATRRIYDRFHQEKLIARLQAQTHDQLYVECPNKEIDIVKSIMKEEMERPVQFYDHLVRFPVEFEVGPSWGELA